MVDLSHSSYYMNRELSWLEFNFRVLEEAQDKTNPAMERLKFLAIAASNLDEFFMVRVSGLWDLVEAGYTKKDASGLTPVDTLSRISEKVHDMTAKQYSCFTRSISPILNKEGLAFAKYADLTAEQKRFVKDYFNSTLFPILTPMAIDQSRPFPLLANKSLNLLAQLDEEHDELYALIQVPSVLPRVLEIPKDLIPQPGKRLFMLLEDVIKKFAEQLFQGHAIREIDSFRITRNSDLTIDEEDVEDLLQEIERSIKKRKWGEPVRLEVEKSIHKESLRFLMKSLELAEEDIYEISGPLDLTFLFSFAAISGYENLRNKPMPPVPSPAFYGKEDIFAVIREQDVLVHHPYEEFDAVLHFINEAACDPQVLAIKQTLYRVSGNSPVINALITAAENGKQVTVLMELKARFDEENNILWAKKLEKAGCHVVYGLVGLKTHCKICLVVRKEDDGIYRYVHLSTGNYNDSTAKIYTDLGLFTSKESFGSDTSSLFNVLTGYSKPPQWKKLAVAPTSLRTTFLHHIDNEIALAQKGVPAKIIVKVNSLVDGATIQALYRASIAGVRIFLIVRGICCLKPGIKGVSENITVISIVDRFLEHSRIFYFENGGRRKIFLSSADWMPRNLDRRVEVAFPIEDEKLKLQVIKILDITLSDTVKARELQKDGTSNRIDRRGKESVQSQLVFYRLAEQLFKEAKEAADNLYEPIKSEDLYENMGDTD